MSRSRARVLIEHVDRGTYQTEQIIQADGLFAVLYRGAPFNVKSFNKVSDSGGAHYKRTCFPTPGPAHALARRLNKKFNSEDFTVAELYHGTRGAKTTDSENRNVDHRKSL